MRTPFILLCWCSVAWAQRESVPDPAPDLPVCPIAAITVVDSTGAPVGEKIGLGQQIVCTAEKAVRGRSPLSLVWIVSPEVQTYTTPDGATLVMTTPAVDATLTIMQLVALGDEVAWQRIAIKCGQGAQPPPGPGPVPNPVPGPAPLPPVPVVPTAKTLFLAVVEKQRSRTPETAIVLNAIAVWNSFREDGVSDWRFYDISTNEAKGKKALADASADKVELPALVLYNGETGSKLVAVPLPKTIPALQSTVAKHKGAAP